MAHEKASDPQQVMGRQLANTLIGGTAVGAGATGLWMLAKYLKNKANEKREPDVTDIATAPLVPPTPQQKIAEDNIAQLLAMPAAGAGIGALLGAVRGRRGNKMRSALTGAGVGGLTGAAGAALSSDAAHKFIGEHIPNFGPSWGERAGKGNPDDPRSTNAGQFAARALGGITLAGLGAYGGSKMIDAMSQHDNSEQNRNGVQKARQEYFDALLNNEKHAGLMAALGNLSRMGSEAWEKIKATGSTGPCNCCWCSRHYSSRGRFGRSWRRRCWRELHVQQNACTVAGETSGKGRRSP
jgi:hypothetical protein